MNQPKNNSTGDTGSVGETNEIYTIAKEIGHRSVSTTYITQIKSIKTIRKNNKIHSKILQKSNKDSYTFQ